MADMTAFERQLAARLELLAGPEPHVDAMASARTAMTIAASRRHLTMFSALKFAAAGVIVALFSGLLLAGILGSRQEGEMAPAAVTESPSLLTTEALLSGMVTEEVEPGVLKVVHDGVRDLTTAMGSQLELYAGAAAADYIYPGLRAVIVGDDGVVWRTAACVAPALESRCLRLYRVGRDGEWDLDPVPVSFWEGQVDAGPDGRLWALAQDGPREFDDGAWLPDAGGVKGDFDALAVQADGTVWLKSNELCWSGETSTGCSRWPDPFAGADYGVAGPVVADDSIVWLAGLADDDGSASFLRFDGTDWQVVPAPADYPGDPTSTTHPLGMTVDGGTVWTAGDPLVQHQSLTRLDETGWRTFTSADGVGTWGGQRGEWNFATDMLKVSPDGSAWVNATGAPAPGSEGTAVRSCDGVARFDGLTWQPFLAGSCIADLDFAPDGSAWVVALDPTSQEVGTYVISPESVSTPEVAAGPFAAGEPVDLLFISDSSGSIVRERYAELAGEALGREIRLDTSVDADPQAIRTRFAEAVAEAEIIVFYHHSGGFEQDMPAPTFERGCIDPVAALEDPNYLEDPDYLGPEWTPGARWEPVSVVPAAEDWQPYRDWLSSVWEAIWEARDGRPVVLRGYDVYNPWFGQWVELGVEPECTAIWEGQAQAAREAAEANGAVFVSFYDLFNGPDHDEDARAKGWIGDDGFHANEAGGAAAAEALAAIGFELSEPPR